MISALKGDGVADLKHWLANAVPAGPWLYPEDQIADAPSRSLAAEITREKLYLRLHQELPYQSTVETEAWNERPDGSLRIEQTIYVERESQRKIVLGKGGQTIKAIGAAARQEIAALFERPRASVPVCKSARGLERGSRALSGNGTRVPERLAGMEWSDEAIVLGTRRHGEANVILEVLTRAHGRHLGLVRGGAGTRLRPILQPGNSASVTWRARLDEHLGHFAVEGLRLRAGEFLNRRHAIFAVTHLATLIRLLPERDPHEDVFDAFETLLDRIDAPDGGRDRARLYSNCRCWRNSGSDLIFPPARRLARPAISPMCRRNRDARSRAPPGEAWRDKLLPLPCFLLHEDATPTATELADGFALTGFFLERHAFEPRGLMLGDARAHFVEAILRLQETGGQEQGISHHPDT